MTDKLKIIKGDITELDVDVIVNAANNSLIGGGGVDGAIHHKAGRELDIACEKLGGCPTGEAKITNGYNLKAKYVIHTVAPKWFDSSLKNKEELLRKCYENSYKLAKENKLKTIAFPCLGAGIYQVPIEVSAKISIDEAIRNSKYFNNIVLVCFSEDDYNYYNNYLNNLILKELQEQIEIIYRELIYIKLEFEFMKDIDDSIMVDRNSFKKIEIISFLMIDSLWYTIIMRIAKIWDDTDEVNSLLKIFKRILSNPIMEEIRNKISSNEITAMKEKIEKVMNGYSINIENVNLFEKSRNKYFAHITKLDSPQAAQNEYLIGRNRIEKLIKVLFEIVEEICLKLDIATAKDDIKYKVDILSNVEYPYFLNSINRDLTDNLKI